MFRRRSFKMTSLFALILALFVGTTAWVDAGKAEDAKKFTEQLKSSKDAKKKAEALDELGKLGQIMKSLVTDATPYIAKALEDKDATVRSKAAEAYGKIDPDPKEAVPALVKLLKDDKETSVRISAAKGLAAMGNGAKEALPALKEVKNSADKKSDLSKQVTTAMKSINDKPKN